MKKKICKNCGRNRRIGKFGRRSDKPDFKNQYCRDCMRDKRSRYSHTVTGKQKLDEAKDKWKKGNKKHIKEYNKLYYEKNKERILYNKRAREETECVLIFENTEKTAQRKINKDREKCIVINPKRK